MNARDSAKRRARFLCYVFTPDVSHCIVLQRLCRKASLLRAVVHEAVFADIQVARTGPATPVTRLAISNFLLEVIDLREMPFLELLHFKKHFALTVRQRPQLAVPIVDNSDS